ncbi:4a-hydroxytetrahydrobiopterin dehydratase [Candidatus Babeliales bacterium]|nr:4a-hydroxytetrahydrobiopterin dehydratase [Candidatus Babeliales bacterium]
MKIIVAYFLAALMIANNALALATCTLCENKKLMVLSPQTISNFIKKNARWHLEKTESNQQFVCSEPCNFIDAARIINCIATIAETQQHHPDIIVTQESITISIYTHSQNALTGKDIAFVTAVEKELKNIALTPSSLDKKISKESVEQRCSAQELTTFLAENQFWRLAPDSSALQFSYDTPNFTNIAHALEQCLQLETINAQIVEVLLSYGTCSVTLRSSNNYISTDTLAQAQECQRIFDHFIAQ